ALQHQLKGKLTHRYLHQRLKKLLSFEFHPLIRVVIRPIKDMILKGINWFNNRQVSIALSNLGRVSLPEPFNTYVEALYFHTSAVRPQMSVISFQDKLTVSFSSPFVETAIQEQFVRMLTQRGIPVKAAANKVRQEGVEGVLR